jgi:hypothetical protein
MKSFTHKLKAYSALAATALCAQEASAQVIYTDLEPDFVLNEPGMWAALDIDNEAGADFWFLNVRSMITTFFGPKTYEFIYALTLHYPHNEIAASTQTFIDDPKRGYPFALTEGVLINSELQFDDGGGQWMAFRTFHTNHIDEDTFLIINKGGNWYPYINNHYLGIYFEDGSGYMHYGWIRCSVKHEGRILVIKDFAYEQQPEVPIVAGSTESYVPVHENENSATISVYSFENKVIINTSENFGNAILISVFDITGKKITTQTGTAGKTEIPVTVPEGIYIVEVTSEENKFVKKVYL